MIPLGVQNPKYDDAVAFDAIENLVRKTVRHQTAEPVVVNGAAFGLLRQQLHGMTNFSNQFIAKTWPLSFIPQPGIAQIRLGSGSDDDAPVHRRDYYLWRRA